MATKKEVPTPKGAWSFDKDVTGKFNDHVRQSVPGYDIFHSLAVGIASFFIQNDTNVYDLGTSTGEGLRNLLARFKGVRSNVDYIGVDNSKPMCDAAQECVKSDGVSILNTDITWDAFTMHNASLVTSFLTLQFLPIHKRQAVVQKIYDGLNVGGGFILVEKVVGESAQTDEIFVDLYHDFKLDQGLTKEHIFDKSRSIRGVMRPITLSDNVKMLKQAGFRHVDVFFKHLNFVGVVGVK